MDKNTLASRIEKIQDEIFKLTNTLFAMSFTDTEQYPQNYEQLSTDAAMRAERIACSLRNFIYAANIIPKAELMDKAAEMQGISVTQAEDMVIITLPGLLPKRKRGNSTFLTDPLHYSLETYVRNHELQRFSECVVCFTHIYDIALSTKRIRDYDNQECKNILDTVAAFVMIDDTGLLCDAYHTTQLGSHDCTILTIMDKKRFPDWLYAHKDSLNSLSDFS